MSTWWTSAPSTFSVSLMRSQYILSKFMDRAWYLHAFASVESTYWWFSIHGLSLSTWCFLSITKDLTTKKLNSQNHLKKLLPLWFSKLKMSQVQKNLKQFKPSLYQWKKSKRRPLILRKGLRITFKYMMILKLAGRKRES